METVLCILIIKLPTPALNYSSIRGLYSNLNAVCYHLEMTNPASLFQPMILYISLIQCMKLNIHLYLGQEFALTSQWVSAFNVSTACPFFAFTKIAIPVFIPDLYKYAYTSLTARWDRNVEHLQIVTNSVQQQILFAQTIILCDFKAHYTISWFTYHHWCEKTCLRFCFSTWFNTPGFFADKYQRCEWPFTFPVSLFLTLHRYNYLVSVNVSLGSSDHYWTRDEILVTRLSRPHFSGFFASYLYLEVCFSLFDTDVVVTKVVLRGMEHYISLFSFCTHWWQVSAL